MASSRSPGGFQRSFRDLYPDYTGALSTPELSVPEVDELDHYNGGATANIETAGGVVRPVKKSDLMQVLAVVGVGFGLLWLLNKAS